MSNIRNDDRPIFVQHQVKDRVCAGNFAGVLPTAGFDPDAALVPEGKAGRVGLEKLGRKARDSVEARLRRCIEDFVGRKRGEAGYFLPAFSVMGLVGRCPVLHHNSSREAHYE